MSYSDFMKHWDKLEMVHLSIDSFSGIIQRNHLVIIEKNFK